MPHRQLLRFPAPGEDDNWISVDGGDLRAVLCLRDDRIFLGVGLVGLCWSSLSATIFVVSVGRLVHDRSMENWLWLVFTSVFLAIGIWLLWCAWRSLFEEHLTLRGRYLEIESRVFGKARVRRYELVGCKPAELVQYWYQPDHGEDRWLGVAVDIETTVGKVRIGDRLVVEGRHKELADRINGCFAPDCRS